MRAYLLLALFWLVVALFVLIYPLYYPDTRTWTFLTRRLSAGWLVLVFVGWNLMRWWTTRQPRNQGEKDLDHRPPAK